MAPRPNKHIALMLQRRMQMHNNFKVCHRDNYTRSLHCETEMLTTRFHYFIFDLPIKNTIALGLDDWTTYFSVTFILNLTTLFTCQRRSDTRECNATAYEWCGEIA